MAIAANSRYVTNTLLTVDVDGTSIQVILPNNPVATTISYMTHIVAAHETVDNLAFQYYGDPTQWWVIANANPSIIDWNTALAPGTTIRIPVSASTSS